MWHGGGVRKLAETGRPSKGTPNNEAEQALGMSARAAAGTDVQFKNPISRERSFDGQSSSPPASVDVHSTGMSVDALHDAVLPESLDVFGSDNAEPKENERDRRRRVAIQKLADSKVIDPNGKFRRKWDFIQMILLVYVAFGVPYRLGFSHPVLLWSDWFWFDLAVDLYFVADIAVSLGTAFWDDAGELIVEPSDIRRNYLRTWFAVDLCSCFPGNYISCEFLANFLTASPNPSFLIRMTQECARTDAMEGEGGAATRVIKLLRMLRLLKLLRLARINRLVRKYEEEFASLMTTMKLGKLIIVIVVVGHWLSCCFFFAGEINEISFEDIDDDYDPGLDVHGNETVGWVYRHFDPDECGPGYCYEQKYLTSFCEC